MEKLLELLNEYGKGSFELEIDNDTGDVTGGIVDAYQDTFEVTSYYITMQIISKRFGFIERLVKNDKIDFDKKDYPLRYNSYYPDRFGIVSIGVDDYEEYLRVDYDRCETLLMLLAISDTPIEDLISYLKE